MQKSALCLVLALSGTLASPFSNSQSAQDKPKDAQAPSAEPQKIPQEELDRKNPVKPTAEGLAAARKIFSYDCAMCHGAQGDGKGDLVDSMKLTLPNWRDAASPTSKKSDGELFYVISQGRGKMEGEKDRATETIRWNLVNLVRSFSTKPVEKP